MRGRAGDTKEEEEPKFDNDLLKDLRLHAHLCTGVKQGGTES